MAGTPGPFKQRLLAAWWSSLHRLGWEELEANLMQEDMTCFNECKHFLVEAISAEIDHRAAILVEQTKDAPKPFSHAQALEKFDAAYVIRSMDGRRAKKMVQAVIALHQVVTETIEFKLLLSQP